MGTSTDGGEHFHAPLYAEYARKLLNTSGRLKNPRGPITPRRFSNGRYLLLYFNRANGGIQGNRNPYWLAAGTYDAARDVIWWSQPEIILYTHYATVDANDASGGAQQARRAGAADKIGEKLGYPDLFEFEGSYYMTETDKITARLHHLPPDLVSDLFAQGMATGGPTTLKPLFQRVRSAGSANCLHPFPASTSHAATA